MNKQGLNRDIEFGILYFAINVIYAIKHNLTDKNGPNWSDSCSYENVEKECKKFSDFYYKISVDNIILPTVDDAGKIHEINWFEKQKVKNILRQVRERIWPEFVVYFQKNHKWDFTHGRIEFVDRRGLYCHLTQEIYFLLEGGLIKIKDDIGFTNVQKGWLNRKTKELLSSLESNLDDLDSSHIEELLAKIKKLKSEFHIEANGLLID